MSLSKQTIEVPFIGGVDTKTAEKLVRRGFFLDLQNVVRRKNGALAKRYGFTAFAQAIFGSTSTISAGKRLTTFRDDLLLFDDTYVYSYSTARNAWAQRGQVVSALVESTPVVRTPLVQAMPDIVTYQGITVCVWEDSRNGIRCTVTDDASNAPLLADTQVTASGVRPKVVAFNNIFMIGYIDGSDLKCRRITVADPTTLQTEQTIEAATATNYPWDLSTYGNVGVFVYNKSTVSRIGYVTSSGAVGSPATNGFPDPVDFAASQRGRNAINLKVDTTANLFYITYHDPFAGTQVLKCVAYTPDLATSYTATIETLNDVRNVTATVRSTGGVRIFYEISDADIKKTKTRQNTAVLSSGTLTPGTPADFLRSVGLAGKAFTIGTKEYVTVVHESTLQSTYFVAQQDGFIVARMQPSFAAGLTRDTSGTLKSGLSRVSQDADGRYIFAVPVKNKLITEDSTVQSSYVGINKQALTFGSNAYNSDTLGENLHVAGGVLLAYDGVSAVEHGFHLAPEDITATASSTSGSVSAGNYLVAALYEWVDGQGQIHRSSPNFTSVTATANKKIDVVVPTLRLTQKTGTRADARIVVYRSLVGGDSVLYRDLDAANDPTNDTVTISVTQADTTLATKEILYTTGGVLDNTPAPACTSTHKHKGRLFLFGLEDQYAVAYSKQQVYGEGVGFSDGFVRRVDPRGGPVRCGSTLDDKLVIFKDSAIFIQVGDGPLETGAQDDYSDPQLISSDVGCSNPRSICIMPKGVMFQSSKGIWLLGRGLETVYVGAPVEKFNDLTITSATLIEDQNEVRFTTSTGVCLVYNYLFDQWSTFSNYAAEDACNFLGSYCHLTTVGRVNQEVSGQYNDNGQTYSQRIETAWFNLGRVQGFQRIYRWALLGDFISHCTARVSIAYDYEDVYNQTVLFRTQTGLGTDTYGDDVVYGDSSVYGGTGSTVFQFRSKPRKQKCESIKLLIEDLDNISTNGGGSFDLVSLAFDVGAKGGIFRTRTTKNVG